MPRPRSRKEIVEYSSSDSEIEQPRRSTRPKTKKEDLEAFGYSSSSSDDDDRSRKASNSSANNQNQKKKKKRKPSPQRSINRIWRHFTAKKFTKALAVLPFDPVPLPTNQERPNELLSAGYERAVEECRRKVKKIIQECRRVNTRYRDPGWDVDWDLKLDKGDCLNFLGGTKFNLSGPHYSSSTAIPKSVKRVHEIFEEPTFMRKLDAGDVKQGYLGDCWMIASLSALANTPNGIQRMCVEYDTRIGIYGFVFYRDGEWVYSIIDDKLYLTSTDWDSPSMQRQLLSQIDREAEDAEEVYRKTYQTGSKALFFASNKDQNETWVPLIEKAYAKVHGDFSSLIGGWIGEGLEDLSGGVTTELLGSDILDLDGFWENELSKVNEEFLFGCSTGLLDGGYGERNGIREGHAYVVMDARTLKNGERLVKLRNPWGKLKKGIWDGPWSDGSKEWTSEAKEELGHNFGNDSVFWIRYKDMLRKYLHFDRTRLFRDPDWRCCQRWIGVEVPWKPQFNEKFHFTLTKESPLVLVLSQLDSRYYKGLLGQYRFRLHFRLHEQGKPDGEDYIVRSHGNYLMDRSVSIELPSMEPGKYSVFVSVVAQRDADYDTVEDVVKRECKKRENHEKLAAVGYAYDLAHAKGVAHLEQVNKLRKSSDAKKASESRKQERRKLWDKRHKNREVVKRQRKKNQEKHERNHEARVAERKKKEEAEAAERKKKEEAEAAEQKVKEEAEAAEQKKKDEALAAEQKQKTEDGEAGSQQTGADASQDKAIQTDQSETGESKAVQTDQTDEKDSAAASESPSKETDVNADKQDSPILIETPSEGATQTGPAAQNVGCSESLKTETPQTETQIGELKTEAPVKNQDTEIEDTTDAKMNEGGDKPAPKPSVAKSSPPPPPAAKREVTSEDDSSDSPVSDWEELYSSDDMSKKPRMAPPPPPAATTEKATETDEEAGMPDPWNAICIVGFRVYSKDENLDLRVVIEGGELLENGMGSKGSPEIDNAQINAAGEREKNAESEKTTDEVEIVDGAPVVKQKVHADEQKKEEQPPVDRDENEKTADDDAQSVVSDDSSSPLPTPGEDEDPSHNCTPQRC